jgi:hypothetical protein
MYRLSLDTWVNITQEPPLVHYGELLQTHINFPRFLPIFPDFLERLSHLAPIY